MASGSRGSELGEDPCHDLGRRGIDRAPVTGSSLNLASLFSARCDISGHALSVVGDRSSAGARRVILQPEVSSQKLKLSIENRIQADSHYHPYDYAIPTSICFEKELQPTKDRLLYILDQE